MKTSTPAKVSSSSVPWRFVAVVSLVTNLVLLGWLWRAYQTQEPVAHVESTSREVAAAKVPASTAISKSTYAALGSYMAENNRIPDLNWTPAQFAEFIEGFRASYEGRGLPLDDDAKRLRDEISERVQGMLAREQPNPVQDYFRTLREKEGVTGTASGLHYRITEAGFGSTASATDTVVLSFAARLPDGRELPPLTRTRVKMAVRDLLPGLAEGVQLLRVGGKALVYLPPELAFSDETWPAQIPRGAPLAFFLELHEIDGSAK